MVTLKKACYRIFFFCFIFCSSCSLDYFEHNDASSSSPEFVFFDAVFTRTENNAPNIRMSVSQLEQYSDGGYTFAKQPDFTLFDSDEVASIIGYCDLLSANTDTDEYVFYGDVSLISYEHDAKVEAGNLRWRGNDEVFQAAPDETVTISIGGLDSKQGDASGNSTELFIEGTGFSASGVDFSYSFSGPVRGSIVEN